VRGGVRSGRDHDQDAGPAEVAQLALCPFCERAAHADCTGYLTPPDFGHALPPRCGCRVCAEARREARDRCNGQMGRGEPAMTLAERVSRETAKNEATGPTTKETETMSTTAPTNMKPPTNGAAKPERYVPAHPREQEIRRIFNARFRELSALFGGGKEGDAKVTRATLMACTASQNIAAQAQQRKKADEVTAESLISCALSLLFLDLDIGEAGGYVVPYGREAQVIVSPVGLITLAMRSGFVKSVYAGVVFWADVDAGLFDYDLPNATIRHKKAIERGREVRRPRLDGGKGHVSEEELVAYAYCVIETTTGGRILEVLTREDIEWYRHFSAAQSGPWFDHYAAMCRKTAEKRGLANVPHSPMLSAALRETDRGGVDVEALGPEVQAMINAAMAQRDGKATAPPAEQAPAAEEAPQGYVSGTGAAS
jgi:recombination protein RecT